jgi:hypothetical protein
VVGGWRVLESPRFAAAVPADPQDFIDVDKAAAGLSARHLRQLRRAVRRAGLHGAGRVSLTGTSRPADASAFPARSDGPRADALPDGSPALVCRAPDRPRIYGGADTDSASVHVTAPDGTADVSVARGNRPSWAPDGTHLAYDCRPRGDAGFPGSICVTDVDAGGSRAVLGRAWRPRWAPVGVAIAFSRSVVDLGDAWVRDLKSGATTQLPGGGPEWSPTGDWLTVAEINRR